MAVESSKGSRVARALTGLVTIIVGVIIALAANAWWQGREDRARIHGYLEMLRVDLHATDSLIDESIAQDWRSMTDSRSMAETLVSGRSWAQLPDSVNPHFGSDDAWFRTGTVNALLATGDINHIRSVALRSALVRYADEVDEIRNALSRVEAASWSNVDDWLMVKQELIEASGDENLRRHAMGMSDAEVLRSFDLRRIRRYPRIAATFEIHANAMSNRIEVLRMAKGPVEDLLRLLDQELGTGG